MESLVIALWIYFTIGFIRAKIYRAQGGDRGVMAGPPAVFVLFAWPIFVAIDIIFFIDEHL